MPLILDDADLLISTDGTDVGLTSLACLTNHLELSPDVIGHDPDDHVRREGLPGRRSSGRWWPRSTSPSTADATEEVLSAAVALGTRDALPDRARASDEPISATNPAWQGDVIPQPYPPINGDAGDVVHDRAGVGAGRPAGQDHHAADRPWPPSAESKTKKV